MLVKNFLFHRVSDEHEPSWQPHKPVLFEKIIKELVKKYTVLSLEDFLEQPTRSKKIKKPAATVSFDDGYKDNIEYAAPVLKKYNCPASFYIVTECIDQNKPTWTYIVDRLLNNTGSPVLFFEMDFVPPQFREVSPSDPGKIGAIKPWMKSLPNDARLIVMQSILQQCNDVGIPADKMMCWDDVRQLKTAGFYIGSHTHTHPMLASIHDENEIKQELTVSACIIQQRLGTKPLTISYPIGSYDERVIRISKSAGYKYGLAVEGKIFHYGTDDVMTIPRIELYQEPWWKVRLRMSNIFQLIK